LCSLIDYFCPDLTFIEADRNDRVWSDTGLAQRPSSLTQSRTFSIPRPLATAVVHSGRAELRFITCCVIRSS
jgi:hypothetical protein